MSTSHRPLHLPYKLFKTKKDMNEEFYQTAFALLPISFIGVVVNWLVFFSFRRIHNLQHSFGHLTANQSLADAIHSTTFFFYFCPMVLLKANTYRIIIAIWVVIGSLDIWLYEYLCHAIYDEKTHTLEFGKTELCGLVGWYGDLVKNGCTVIFIVASDVLTLIGVRRIRSFVNFSDEAQKRIYVREKRFLKQIVFQGIIFILELSTYFFVPQFTHNTLIIFFATTFSYVTVHVLDGLVVILCYPEIRSFLLCRSTSPADSSAFIT
ncbi:hypothetical protein GCK72_020021 [Caenorhabditis remanei]|uniref:7TM GPCR serpentine receptor class x (Srx) domain-containing protein n=1 Tax=Caenorhabditis remanei TaxID=31234 RepID=A0A6A5GFD9_CAERE|nr:hypothetical protein GCK72_020021 [Caenorhabditis remanei]KAF1753464.1 hypothetical protein GCK72_020021 [Caenorhabditis remanei]